MNARCARRTGLLVATVALTLAVPATAGTEPGTGDTVASVPSGGDSSTSTTTPPEPRTTSTIATPTAPSTPAATPSQPTESSDGDGVPVWSLPVVGLAGSALGAGLVGAARSRRRYPAAKAGPASAGPPPVVGFADGQLDGLVQSVVDARDLVEPGTVLSQRLEETLRLAGVVESHPLGQPFDARRHHAVDVVETAEVDQVDRIAEVQRVGYSDASGHRIFRLPEVVVYRLDPPS